MRATDKLRYIGFSAIPERITWELYCINFILFELSSHFQTFTSITVIVCASFLELPYMEKIFSKEKGFSHIDKKFLNNELVTVATSSSGRTVSMSGFTSSIPTLL